MDLGNLLILLLPGFWSLWVFKRVTYEDLNKKQDRLLVMLGLCFGVVNLAVYSWLLHFHWFQFITGASCQGFVSEKECFSLLFTANFLKSYFSLAIIALLVGAIAAILRGKNLWPVHWVAVGVSKILDRKAINEEYENSLSYLIEKNVNESTVMKIYPIGSPERAVIGTFNGSGSGEQDVLLEDTHLYDPSGFPYGYKSSSCVIIEKGIVVECVVDPCADKEKMQKPSNKA